MLALLSPSCIYQISIPQFKLTARFNVVLHMFRNMVCIMFNMISYDKTGNGSYESEDIDMHGYVRCPLRIGTIV